MNRFIMMCAALLLGAAGAWAQVAELGDLKTSDKVATEAHTLLHGHTTEGGFQGGDGATTTYGAAIGRDANSQLGAAVGATSQADGGGAVGMDALTIDGGAVGLSATTSHGFAGGNVARAHDGLNPIDAIQLGSGQNTVPYTLQIYTNRLLNADGSIPVARIPGYMSGSTISNLVGDAVSVLEYNINNYYSSEITTIYTITSNLTTHAVVTQIVEYALQPVWTAFGNHTNWHGHTQQGGFWGGIGAHTESGGAIGANAASMTGGAIGDTSDSYAGGAMGNQTFTVDGGAVGAEAYSIYGGAVGYTAVTGQGFAGGLAAQTVAAGYPIDAIQLGTGINPNPGTLQIYNNQLLDAAGKIPAARLPYVPGMPTTEGGFAGGENATTRYGAAIGLDTTSNLGAALGATAQADGGGAVGMDAQTIDGGAVGLSATTSHGFAGGNAARAHDGLNPIDAIQLGTGINPNPGTLQIYNNQLLDAAGKIPAARLPYVPGMPTNAVQGWLMFDPGSNMWLRVTVSNMAFTVWEVVP